MKRSELKALLLQHKIQKCSVRIVIDPEIEAMAPVRRSQRIQTKHGAPALPLLKPAKIMNRRSTVAPKSILVKVAAKRTRSKSVFHDLPSRAKQQTQQQNGIASTSQQAIVSAPAISQQQQQQQQKQAAKPSQQTVTVAPAASLQQQGADIQGVLSSAEIRSFENRISNLVSSNDAKIGRIQVLQAEVAALNRDLETAHRLNRALTETIDAYRENDENTAPNATVNQLEKVTAENLVLKDRILRLNRALYQQRAQIDSLKKAAATYSHDVVLQEHNYNINV